MEFDYLSSPFELLKKTIISVPDIVAWNESLFTVIISGIICRTGPAKTSFWNSLWYAPWSQPIFNRPHSFLPESLHGRTDGAMFILLSTSCNRTNQLSTRTALRLPWYHRICLWKRLHKNLRIYLLTHAFCLLNYWCICLFVYLALTDSLFNYNM